MSDVWQIRKNAGRLGIVLVLPASLWASIVIHAAFYDSVGNYHWPTAAHLFRTSLPYAAVPLLIPAGLIWFSLKSEK